MSLSVTNQTIALLKKGWVIVLASPSSGGKSLIELRRNKKRKSISISTFRRLLDTKVLDNPVKYESAVYRIKAALDAVKGEK